MERIERLIASDPGGRGAAALQIPGDLAGAARALAGARRVLISTGFPVGPSGVAETDGPPGALFLGRALNRLGVEVLFATHRPCVGVMQAGLESLGLPSQVVTLAEGEGPQALLDRHVPDLAIAVELPGRAVDGHYYNMRGQAITARVEAVDGLLLAARQRGVGTIAVGDGGNEAGMGKVTDRVHQVVRNGEIIASVVPCDHLIAAGTSNWGAYGLVAALDPGLVHSPEEELHLLERLVGAGALDGSRLEATATVDGVDSATYLEVLARLRRWEEEPAGRRVTA